MPERSAGEDRASAVGFSIGADGTIDVDVHLTARDLRGNVLFDRTGVHCFRMAGGLIARFDIR